MQLLLRLQSQGSELRLGTDVGAGRAVMKYLSCGDFDVRIKQYISQRDS